MKKWQAPVLTLLVTLPSVSVYAQDLSWPTARHDQNRTGHSMGQGGISTPAVTWTYDLGGRLGLSEVWVGDLTGNAQKEFALVESGRIVLKTAQDLVVWASDPIGATQIVGAFDFDGDGRNELLTTSNGPPAALGILDGDTGALLWRFDEFGVGAASLLAFQVLVADINSDDLLNIVCSARVNDQPVHAFGFDAGFLSDPTLNEIWSFDDTYYTQDVTYVAGDVDLDLRTEIIFLENDFISAVDGITGIEDFRAGGSFSSFNFGLLELANVDADPQPEIIVIGDTTYNYAVTVFDAVDGSVTWQYQWHPTFWHDLAFVENSVIDVDDDGALEIVVGVFNDSDDEKTTNASAPGNHDGVDLADRWVVLVLDAATGAVEASLPDAFLSGISRLDPASLPYVFVQSTTAGDPVIPDLGTTSAYRVDGTGFHLRWSLTDASPVAMTRDETPSLNTYDGQRRLAAADLDGDGISEPFLIRDVDADDIPDVLQAVSPDTTPPLSVATLSLTAYESVAPIFLGSDVSSLGMSSETALSRTTGTIDVLAHDFSTAARVNAGGYSTSPIVTDLDGDGQNEMVLAVSTGEIRALDPVSDPPALLWQYWGGNSPVLTAADVDADGSSELAVRDFQDPAEPSVSLLDGDGTVRWKTPFPGFGAQPEQIVFARIDGDATLDLVAFIQDVREDPSTDLRLVALAGIDGGILWNVPTAQNQWILTWIYPVSFGSGPADSLLAIDADNIEIYGGAGGALLDSASYSYTARDSMLADFDGDLDEEILLTSILGADGIQLWEIGGNSPSHAIPFDYMGQLTNRSPSTFDGTGGASGFVQPTPEGKITAYDGDATVFSGPVWLRGGTVYTTDPGGMNDVRFISVCDIDGEGNEEAIVGTSDGYLMAIRIQGASLLWSIPLYASVIEPVLADIDGDGLVEILVVSSNGTLNVIDEASVDPVPEVRDVALSPTLTIIDPGVDIDVTEIRVALGGAWEPVAGASGYKVTVLDEAGMRIVPLQDVGSTTSAVISTAPLLVGSTYRIAVVAYGSDGLMSAETYSDGVLVSDLSIPVIDLFQAVPPVFNPDVGTTTLEARAHDATWIATWTIEIRDSGDLVVATWSGEPFAALLSVDQSWDGSNTTGVMVPDGTYFARLEVVDLADNETYASCEVIVDRSMPDPEPEGIEDVEELEPDASSDAIEDVDGEDDGEVTGGEFYATGGGCGCGIAR